MRTYLMASAIALSLLGTHSFGGAPAATPQIESPTAQIRYRHIDIDGVDIFFREAGRSDAPVLLLLHGFPTSSHMYRNLIPALSDRYRVIAPDYPGFGHSESDRARFHYSFDRYADIVAGLLDKLKIQSYSLYVMDYGAPVGFRLAASEPARIQSIIVQNGNAYEEGLAEFWDPIKAYWNSGADREREAIRWLTSLKATEWQYTNGVRNLDAISPDTWTMDQALLDRPGNQEIQLDLFLDYRTNIPLYPEWQQYFREHQPPTLVIWGKNDEIFVAAGAEPYARDNPKAEVHMLDTGHFALESHGPQIANLVRTFLQSTVPQ